MQDPDQITIATTDGRSVPDASICSQLSAEAVSTGSPRRRRREVSGYRPAIARWSSENLPGRSS